MQGTLTLEQVASLQALRQALHAATECGALDELMMFVGNPDSINDVCDAVASSLDA